jgi:hypothetical protein
MAYQQSLTWGSVIVVVVVNTALTTVLRMLARFAKFPSLTDELREEAVSGTENQKITM